MGVSFGSLCAKMFSTFIIATFLWAPSIVAQNSASPYQSTDITFGHRDLNQYILKDIFIASLLDGSLQARNRTSGEVLWTLESSQSVEISEIQSKSVSKAGEKANIGFNTSILWLAEPSSDGGLYYYTLETGVERIPASLEDLILKAPFGVVGNVVYTGVRRTNLYALDLITGEILQAFGDNTPHVEASLPLDNTIMIGRKEYILDLHESSGSAGWRIRVSIWTPNTRDQDLSAQYFSPSDSLYIAPLSETSIMALKENDERPQSWVSETPALLIEAFDILQNVVDKSMAVVRQPNFNISGLDGDGEQGFYVSGMFNSGTVLRGSRYSALLKSTSQAPYCVLGPEALIRKSESIQFANFHAQQIWGIAGAHLVGCKGDYYSGAWSKNDIRKDRLTLESSETFLPQLDPPRSPLSLPSARENVRRSSKYGMLKYVLQIIGSLTIVCVIAIISLMVFTSNFSFSIELSNKNAAKKEKGNEVKKVMPDGTMNENGDEKEKGDKKESQIGSENENENNAKEVEIPSAEVRRRKRGTRGGKRNNKSEATSSNELINADHVQFSGSTRPNASSPREDTPIVVSDTVLGYGSHGTTVFKGRFENRDVAVKRMLLSFYDLASQEVNLLKESDDHPNVVRYYCKHQSDQFLYIALELCPGTLEDLVTGSHQFSIMYQPFDALRQIVLGVQHLHNLQIVHRDLKPQNILVALPHSRLKHKAAASSTLLGVRYLISDFGLCRKLEDEQSSFLPTFADSVAGTAGWSAPEISAVARDHSSRRPQLPAQAQNQVAESESTAISMTDKDAIEKAAALVEQSSIKSSQLSASNKLRLTKSVDIFSMGCLFYYVLSDGKHPYGEPHMRQVNIQKNYKPEMARGGLMTPEAIDLIPLMLDPRPDRRPTTEEILKHPIFWDDQKKLDFLVRFSDRLEHESREEQSDLIDRLESLAIKVVGTNWHEKLPLVFLENLGKYRKYHGHRILDLLRVIRNKLHHYNDFTDDLKTCVGSVPSEYLAFFTDRFPDLLITIYRFAGIEFTGEDAFSSFL